VFDPTTAVSNLERLVRHLDFVFIEIQFFPEQVVGTFEIRAI
jgi:hypothetical protein